MKRIWAILGGDSRTGFPHFYSEENLGYFWGIAGQGFHTFTVKKIWAIFGGIAGQGFHTLTVKRIWTTFGRMAGQGFHTLALNSNEAIFGEHQDRVSPLFQELEPAPSHLYKLQINHLIRNWTGFPWY